MQGDGEHQSVEQALRNKRDEYNHEYYRDLVNSLGDGVIVFNISKNWEVIDISHGITEMTGYTLKDFPYFMHTFRNLDTPFTLEEARLKNAKAIEGITQVFDWFTRCKDGTPLWLEAVLKHAVLAGADRLVCTVRNITERRDLMDKLGKQLELAQALIKEKDESLAYLQGELCTLVLLIKNIAELLIYTGLGERPGHQAQAISESASRLLKIMATKSGNFSLEPCKSFDLTVLEEFTTLSEQVRQLKVEIYLEKGLALPFPIFPDIGNGQSNSKPASSNVVAELDNASLYTTLFQPESSPRILIGDSDRLVCDYLQIVLGYEGYPNTKIVQNAYELIALVQNTPTDIVIMDYSLPDIEGPRLCSIIRSTSEVGLIILTAREDLHSRVACLKAGADDYLVKPFHFAELLARIESLLRRRGYVRDSDSLAYADLILWPARRVAYRQGRLLPLTPTEFNLLHLFMRHPGQVLSKDLILQHLRGYDFNGNENIAEVYVRYLRRKMGGPQIIHTRRGIGYALAETVDFR